MKIKDIKNTRVIIAIKRICEYVSKNVFRQHILGDDEVELECELAIKKTQRYKDDVTQLSKIDVDVNWGQEKVYIDDKNFIVRETGKGSSPWYSGELELEDLLDSLRSYYEIAYNGELLEEADFVNNFEFLESWIEKTNECLRLKQKKSNSSETITDQDIIKTPIKIEITRLPSIKVEMLNQVMSNKKNKQFKFPFKIPAGTKWQDITIKFLDDENVYIKLKNLEHKTNYKEMGFIGKGKNPKPSEAWVFLRVLAKKNGEFTINDPKFKDRYKKQKQILTQLLQNYFSLDYDPFYPYYWTSEKRGNSYKIKIVLIPPSEKENNNISENVDDLGIKEYLEEETKLIYEK